jgi:L-asparaginase
MKCTAHKKAFRHNEKQNFNRGISGRDWTGIASTLAAKAEFDFFRPTPPGGYSKGLARSARSDVGSEDIKPEVLGKHFFPAGNHRRDALRQDLAKVTNTVQRALNSGKYAGAVWFEGSPTVQDTTYGLSILIDSKVPITGNASQRAHGYLGNDGDRNVIDSVDYILSKAWVDTEGRDQLGAVLIQDEQIFASRQVEKQDARPGGYKPTGGHGGILGTMGDPGPVTIWFKPTTLHTWKSAVNFTQLPRNVKGTKKVDGKLVTADVAVKDAQGDLRGEAIPMVTNWRSNRWVKDSPEADPDEEVEVLARVEKNLRDAPLAGFVAEGNTPYGSLQPSTEKALEIAALSGMPVVRVSRGDQGGRVAADRSSLTILPAIT